MLKSKNRKACRLNLCKLESFSMSSNIDTLTYLAFSTLYSIPWPAFVHFADKLFNLFKYQYTHPMSFHSKASNYTNTSPNYFYTCRYTFRIFIDSIHCFCNLINCINYFFSLRFTHCFSIAKQFFFSLFSSRNWLYSQRFVNNPTFKFDCLFYKFIVVWKKAFFSNNFSLK